MKKYYIGADLNSEYKSDRKSNKHIAQGKHSDTLGMYARCNVALEEQKRIAQGNALGQIPPD